MALEDAAALATALGYLDGPTDEHRVAGLLLLARRDAAVLARVGVAVAESLVASSFLARLLRTNAAAGAATAAQRAGLEVARRPAETSPGARAALAPSLLPHVDAVVCAAADAAVEERAVDADDASAALLCLGAFCRDDPGALGAARVPGAALVALCGFGAAAAP